ncbi:MAG: glycosyltransferase [Treponema sp.]
MRENIAFFYLKTGGGHASGAKSLNDKISSLYPETRCIMYNPFEKRAFLSSLFFEKGYSLTSNYLSLCYLLFYRLTSHKFMLRFFRFAYRRFFLKRFIRFLKREKITKVVCFHEILISHLREAINKVDPNIKLISIVTDPFTAHPIWFYEKQTHLITYSEKITKEAIEKYHFPKELVHTFSAIISDKFNTPYSEQEKQKIKEKLGIPEKSKVVLIAGGGEGLRNMICLTRMFLKRNFNGHIIIVCGKNKNQYRMVNILSSHFDAKNIHAFGFVSCMPDFMNIADCIISKSGTTTIMEALSLAKPLILCSYIRGQELGNMLFVKLNKAGYYLPSSYDAVVKTEEILSSSMQEIQENIKRLKIKNGVEDIAKFVMAI